MQCFRWSRHGDGGSGERQCLKWEKADQWKGWHAKRTVGFAYFVIILYLVVLRFIEVNLEIQTM